MLHTANAQINTNKIKVDLSSLSFKACSDSNNGLSTVTVQSKQGTTTDFQITFDLPNGIYYQTSSLIITSQIGSGDFTISEINISDLNQPSFRIQRPNNVPWQINDQVTFTYQKTADCDAVNFSYNGGLFKDAHSVTFNDHEGSQTASDTNLSINSYNLLRALLAVDDIQSVSDNIGGEQIRNIIVRNSGNGSVQSFEHQVEVSSNLQTGYELEFNGTVLTPNISGNIYTYNIDLNLAPFAGQVGDGDNLFENESITLLERMTISQCSWDETTVHSPRWGCAPGNYCQIGSPITGVFMYEEEWAKLELTPINRPLPRWDAPVTYTYQITNDVTANNAYNVNLNIGFFGGAQMSSTTFNPMWGDDNDAHRQLSDFRIGSGGVITPQRWQNTNDPSGTGLGSFLIPADYLTTDPDGIGGLEDLDGDGFFDDLRPGASTTISFNLAMSPDNPSCNEFSADYLMNESLKMDLWSVTSCSNPTETKREILNSSRVRREALFNWSDPKDYDQDAEEGQIFNLSFIGNFISTSESPTCNGDEMLTNALNTIYTATVTLPNGISLHSSVNSRYSQIGNQVIFTETNLANFVRDGYILEIPINFPLLVDCTTYSGPDYIELDYTTNYSSSCYNQQLHCGSFGVTVHCQSSCDGPTTTSFDANRSTAGWADDTMATKVTLDPSIHATKYYMAKDEMVVTTSAIMINDVKDNLFLEMRYVTDIGFDMSDIILFESGTITINDLSSGSQTTILNVMPTVNTFGTNDNRMTFDLSSYRSIISSTYQYGEGLQADEIQLELHFRFNEDFQEKARLYEFHAFSGQFYSLDSSNNRIGCDIYNDRAFFFENKIQIFEVGNNDFVNGCDEKYIGVGLMQNTTFGDKFPNEFRPPLLLNSATIEIPQGMFFENVVTSYGYPNLQPEDEVPGSWNNGLNYSVSGNIVTITPGSRFRHLDQGGSNYPNIKILVRATSATPAVTNFDYSVDYEKYAYSDNPVPINETQTQIFNYYNREFYIDNIRPVVIGNSELASFTVDIGNGSSVSAINYNWLRVDSGAGYQLTAAYLVEGGTETPINLINESGI